MAGYLLGKFIFGGKKVFILFKNVVETTSFTGSR
jgi:hypothetical protein